MRKRFLSLLCVLALCLGLLPVTALAATVENITYLDENGTQQTAASATQVTNSDTQWTDGWYVAQSNITIDGTVTISGNVHLILEDGCNLTVNGGILLQSDSNMYIYAQSTEKERMGSLTATGTDAGFKEAGYGTQTLTIAGGKISASGSDEGISAVNLTITDGYVSALGTDLYGDSIAVYNATISGGFVDLYGDFTGTLSTGIDGHAVISSTGEIKNIAADCKGFFLIQKTGKIYGDTFTLTQDLNIANSNIVVTVEEGQTLTLDDGVTLTIPVIATLTNNGTLNNNGTIINTGTLNNSGTLNNNGNLNNTSVLNNAGSIINNGTLTGEVGGSGTVTPKITTDSPLPEGTVGESYTATLEATGNNITWSASGLPDGLTLNSDGTITGIPSAEGTPTVTVTATNASGSDSKEYTLNIKSATVPVTGVTLNQAELSLYTGESKTLTATVQPSDATNKNVTWSSSNEAVATVDTHGKVTAVGEGNATITATAEENSNISATCTVTVTQSTYSISADTKALDFGSVYTGYTQPAAKTVTITNDGNQQVTVTPPTANDFVITAGTGFTDSTATLAPKGTATFTVQPKAGLSVGTYSENITVSGSEGATVTIPANFTVEQRDNTPYYGITVNAPANGTVTCYAKSAAKGAEVTLTVKPDVGYALDKLTVTDASGKTVDVTKVDEKTYTFVMPGRAVTVEAVFAPSTSGLPFTDVSAGDWFYEAVQFVYENGLMDGVAGNLFAPNATLNRAMAVTILYRLEGSPDLDGENLGYPFADVDGDAWYGDAVYWARCNGIVDGVENNHFDPTGSLTREQMATVLYRYAQYKGADVSASGDLSGFADSANVSAWAVDAVKWAVGSGLVNGVEGNALAPQGTSTRAQTAAILARFCGSVI